MIASKVAFILTVSLGALAASPRGQGPPSGLQTQDDEPYALPSQQDMSLYFPQWKTYKNLTNDGVRRAIAEARYLIDDVERRTDEFNTIIANNNSYQGKSVRMTVENLALIKALTMSEVDIPGLEKDKVTLDHLEKDIVARPKGSAFMRNLMVSDILRRLKRKVASAKQVIVDRIGKSAPVTTSTASMLELPVDDSEEATTVAALPAHLTPLLIDWAKVHNGTDQNNTKEDSQKTTTKNYPLTQFNEYFIPFICFLIAVATLILFLVCQCVLLSEQFRSTCPWSQRLIKAFQACGCICEDGAQPAHYQLNEIPVEEDNGGGNRNLAVDTVDV